MQTLKIIATILGYISLGIISFAVVVSSILFTYVITVSVIEQVKDKINKNKLLSIDGSDR